MQVCISLQDYNLASQLSLLLLFFAFSLIILFAWPNQSKKKRNFYTVIYYYCYNSIQQFNENICQIYCSVQQIIL